VIVVVGAGLSGAVIAERFASQLGERVLVVEKRGHVGGNCADFTNDAGLLVPEHGPHFFHTRDEEVWAYLTHFCSWRNYEHRVLSYVDGHYVPVPVNIHTVNILFGLSLSNREEMEGWLLENVTPIAEPRNSEEAALRRVGRALYEKMFAGYTRKQWGMEPSALDARVMDRIPVRTNFDDRYFDDPYQAVPVGGYTLLVQRLLTHSNIEVRTRTDYFEVRGSLPDHRLLFYTGRLDWFFGCFDKLEYRSIRFEHETYDSEFMMPSATVNYPNAYKCTRVSEPKRATGQVNPKTTLITEYPTWVGEPYYPVITRENEADANRCRSMAAKMEKSGTYFLGRLAEYKYINMDQAVRGSLDVFEKAKKQ